MGCKALLRFNFSHKIHHIANFEPGSTGWAGQHLYLSIGQGVAIARVVEAVIYKHGGILNQRDASVNLLVQISKKLQAKRANLVEVAVVDGCDFKAG